MNNILGVDLKIDQKYIENCVKEVVQASMTEALGSKNEIVSEVVNELLKTKVDKDNGRVSTSSWGTEPLIDHYLRESIIEVVKQTIKTEIELRKPELEKLIKNELNKKSNMQKFVDSFINNTTETLENSWRTKIDISFTPVKEE